MTVPGNPTFGAPPTYGQPVAAPSRPMTATLAFYAALVAGLFTIIGAVLLIVNAKDTAKQAAADLLGVDPSELGSDFQSDLDSAASTLVVRGILGLISGALVVAIALAMRNAALWARIVETVLLVGGLCANGLVVRDVAPAATKALDIAAVLLSLVAVVLMFLPATNKFAAARKRP
jgi:FtsH-binding integral membrane protein